MTGMTGIFRNPPYRKFTSLQFVLFLFCSHFVLIFFYM